MIKIYEVTNCGSIGQHKRSYIDVIPQDNRSYSLLVRKLKDNDMLEKNGESEILTHCPSCKKPTNKCTCVLPNLGEGSGNMIKITESSISKLSLSDIMEYPYRFNKMWKGSPNPTFGDDFLELAEEHNCILLRNDGYRVNFFACKEKSDYEELKNALSDTNILKDFIQLSSLQEIDWELITSKIPSIYVDRYTGGYSIKCKPIKTEGNYGGAFDIRDNQYFTTDDLDEFSNYVIEKLSEVSHTDIIANLVECYLDEDTNILEMTVSYNDYEHTHKEKIDMRKIKVPKDLIKAYSHKFVNNFLNSFIADIEHDEVIKESYTPYEEDIIEMYLNGDSVSEIAYNLNLTRADVKVVIDDYMESRKRKKNKLESIISVEYTYDGDEVSDYVGHIKVCTDNKDIAINAAKKYIKGTCSEYNPRNFSISNDNYNNIDVIDVNGNKITENKLTESNSEYIKHYKDGKGHYISVYRGKDGELYAEGDVPASGYTVKWDNDMAEHCEIDLGFEEIKDLNPANINLDEYEYCSHGNGRDSYWQLYRKIVDGKGKWVARHQNTGEIREISYDQARGFEPIDDSSIRRLSRSLGSVLLPKRESNERLLNNINSKVKAAARKFMMLPEIGFPEEEVDEYLSVNTGMKDGYIVINIGAELSYEPLSNLCDTLNKVIVKYDKDAYFEPECPGRIVAYIDPNNR